MHDDTDVLDSKVIDLSSRFGIDDRRHPSPGDIAGDELGGHRPDRRDGGGKAGRRT